MQNMLSMLNRPSMPILKQPRLHKPRAFPFLFSVQKRDSKRKILVDASTMRIQNIIQLITAKIEQGYIFIMTPTNRAEISLLTTYEKQDQSSNNAAAFLELERKYPKSFVNVNEFSRLKDPDSRIICLGLLNNAELWTSDGGAKDRAERLGYKKVTFLDSNQLNPRPEKKNGTFWQAKLEGDSLVLSNKQTIRYICIIRDRKVYENPGNGFELKKGDKVIVCIKKLNFDVNLEYVAFAAYTIISISESDNVSIDYTHQFYDRSEPFALKNKVYTTILKKYIDKFLPNFPEKYDKPFT